MASIPPLSPWRPLSWWRWLNTLSRNPVYLRERGDWGEPNPYYKYVRQWSPLVIIAALILAMLTVFSNPSYYLGTELALINCFICLPGVIVTGLRWFGLFLTPALTAPSLNSEMSKGSWDLLRLTPQSTGSLLLAKLLGGLARLPIWRPLFALTAFQAAILLCGSILSGGELLALPLVLSFSLGTLLAPWLEVGFFGFASIMVSTWLQSPEMALGVSYAVLLLVKIINSSLVWLGIGSLIGYLLDSDALFDLGSVLAVGLGPVLFYGTGLLLLWLLLLRRAEKISV